MTASAPATDVRRFLDPRVASQIDQIDLRARLVVEGFLTGLHRSPFHGFSVEFAEHRPYSPGDPIRHLDWKVFAKADRYYHKRYHEETNLRSYLLVDQSASMGFSRGGRISKLFNNGFGSGTGRSWGGQPGAAAYQRFLIRYVHYRSVLTVR